MWKFFKTSGPFLLSSTVPKTTKLKVILTFLKLFYAIIQQFLWTALLNFVYNNQFLANFEMPEMTSLPFLMNCFCGMVDRRKVFSLISSRDHFQWSSPSQISDTPRAGFEPALNLSSDFAEWSCPVVITTIPRHASCAQYLVSFCCLKMRCQNVPTRKIYLWTCQSFENFSL